MKLTVIIGEREYCITPTLGDATRSKGIGVVDACATREVKQ